MVSFFVKTKKEAEFFEVSRETMIDVSCEEAVAVLESEKVIGRLNW